MGDGAFVAATYIVLQVSAHVHGAPRQNASGGQSGHKSILSFKGVLIVYLCTYTDYSFILCKISE